MSMRNERPDPIDEVIDEAARRLVAGEPSSALRSSVRDRIAKRRSAWSFVPALAGAAALLVVAVIMGRGLSGPVGRILSGPAGGPDSVAPVERPTIERPAFASQPDAPAVIQPEPSTPRQLARRLAADITALPPEEESPIPPIAIEPLTTMPLRAVQIAVDESSGVMPIEIAPLQIEPLLGQ
jgi:hypothetical protein